MIFAPQPGFQTETLLCPIYDILCGGARYAGKMSPLDSEVCTPKGFVKMRDIQVGMQVTDPTTGGATRVIAIHPQPEMDIWRVTFDDDTSLEVGDEHLWSYRMTMTKRPKTKPSSQRVLALAELGTSPAGNNRWDHYLVGTTADIRKAMERGRSIRIPLTEPVTFTMQRSERVEVPAYEIGLLLGDGHLWNAAVTTADASIRDFLLGLGYAPIPSTERRTAVSYRATGKHRIVLRNLLHTWGMLKHRSWEKHIPKSLLHGSIGDRLDVLRGLLDTDGFVSSKGHIEFTSSSKQLSDDVAWLVRSLGGRAVLSVKHPTFRHKGEKREGRPAYLVRITHPHPQSLFRLQRKIDRCRVRKWEAQKTITRIELVGKKKAQCITVDSPYGLYVADDFIVTHNSFLQMLFFLKGNPDLPQGSRDANSSYIFHPHYRALVLRRNYKDMTSWISKAIQMYESSSIGGKWQKSDGLFQFPHPVSGSLRDGAQIIVDHLGDEGAFRKYIGHEYHRMGIEELTFIPTNDLYLGVSTSCRTTIPELRPQILNTSNPEGPGLQWVKQRYMYHPVTGDRVPPKTPIHEEVHNPVTGQSDLVSRIYIPGTIRDNILGMKADPHYAARLAALPPTMRRAYLDGDWDVMAGDTFFSEFRVRRLEGEPANYVHCVPSESVQLNPWDQRWAGMDWGFNHPAAIYWFAKHEQDERIYTYRELITRFMGSYDMGVTFARTTLPDITHLDPPVLTLWLSPDAFSNRDASGDAESTSIVSRFSAGVKSVLGPQSVYIPSKDELEDAGIEPERAEDFFAGQAIVKEANIVIRRAPNQRVAGWQYMRELMTCNDPDLGAKSFDRDYAKELLSSPDGLERYFAYIEAHRKLATRPGLPRLRIFSDRCPKLIESIQKATFADDLIDLRKVNANPQTGEGGDDSLDAARYGLLGFQRIETLAPPTIQRQRKLQILREQFGESPLFWQALSHMEQSEGGLSGYNKSANQFREGINLHRQATHPARRYPNAGRDPKLLDDWKKDQLSRLRFGFTDG